jgi:class 3 adenylate cyclase
MPSPTSDAWLDNPDGGRVPLAGNCSLGRSSENHVVIISERASRRHAIIHAQEGGEFWIADLGSSNGTFLNERRVTHPTLLRDGDVIQIAHARLAFHQAAAAKSDEEASLGQMTVVEVRTEPCWLLIADVADFTPLSQRLPADDLAALMGRWIRTCKEQIERNGGVINKFLGDGFMAYWRSRDDAAVVDVKTAAEGMRAARRAVVNVKTAAEGLRAAQRTSELQFRVVLHYGKVAMGGTASLNEDSLMGPEVNFAFRMEKAASGFSVDFCVSEAAQKMLGDQLPLEQVPGEHELKGFNGKYRFFAYRA